MEPKPGLLRASDVRRTADADAEVAALYARSSARLIGLLTSIGGSRSDAEEVAHDAYVKLLPRWHEVRSYDDPEAWVRTVAVRLLISRGRRASVAARGLARHAGRAPRPPTALSEDGAAVAAALGTLPPAQRAVIVLHHVLDLSVDDIAAELAIPAGTVKSRLSRARAALGPLLSDHEEVTDHA